MSFIPGVLASLLGSGIVPNLIETGAGLLKKVASSVLGERGGEIAGKVIDVAAPILKGIAGGPSTVKALPPVEPSAPHMTNGQFARRPVEAFASRMEQPEDVSTFDTTPAGRMLMPDGLEASNTRTVIVPSPFMPRRLSGPRVAPHAAGFEGDLSEDPNAGFRVLAHRSRARHDNLSAPRPDDAPTAKEAARKGRKKRVPGLPPASFKRYF